MMQWATIITAIVVFDVVLTFFLMKLILANTWKPIMRRYPPREPAPGAVTKNYQSFRFGVCSFGYAIHVTADEDALHLEPIKLLRWAGGGAISIPWSSITVTKPAGGSRWMTVSIDGTAVNGPAWCLQLAGSDEAPATGPESGVE